MILGLFSLGKINNILNYFFYLFLIFYQKEKNFKILNIFILIINWGLGIGDWGLGIGHKLHALPQIQRPPS